MDLLAGPETSRMGTRGRTNPEYVGPSLLPALALHAGIGSGRKAARLHHLAALVRERIGTAVEGARFYAPPDAGMSLGLTTFDAPGLDANAMQKALLE